MLEYTSFSSCPHTDYSDAPNSVASDHPCVATRPEYSTGVSNKQNHDYDNLETVAITDYGRAAVTLRGLRVDHIAL
jgi:hypothetical protein